MNPAARYTVQYGSVELDSLALDSGAVLGPATVAYSAAGTLDPRGENCILVTHGYAGGPAMIDPEDCSPEDSWAELLGPGHSLDTSRFFVVCANALGSAYGSSGPASINPTTGRPFGATFPRITLADIVRSQRLMLEALGVKRVLAVVGVSYGGLLAFQWGIQYPDWVKAVVPTLCSPRAPAMDPQALTQHLASDPHWNGGDYYDGAGPVDTLQRMRVGTLRNYGIETVLQRQPRSAAEREAEIQRIAKQWAERFDAHSLVVLLRAMAGYDATPHFSRIRSRVLYVLSKSDQLFPPGNAPAVMQQLGDAGVHAEFFEIDSACGHFASAADAALWEPRLRHFLASLE